ncbi:MAG: GNAT family N-acetyltransferase, partial [Candidatus Diapherotrites archaeon]|nr:GNAT family N-acetyltransferase [Candidatus Diapherotrites archaeon]
MFVRRAFKFDLPHIARIHSEVFPTDGDSNQWISANFKAFPRNQYFVAIINSKIVGYILWMEKGGFRDAAVIELEQIGITRNCQGFGVGSTLVNESLLEMEKWIKSCGR